MQEYFCSWTSCLKRTFSFGWMASLERGFPFSKIGPVVLVMCLMDVWRGTQRLLLLPSPPTLGCIPWSTGLVHLFCATLQPTLLLTCHWRTGTHLRIVCYPLWEGKELTPEDDSTVPKCYLQLTLFSEEGFLKEESSSLSYTVTQAPFFFWSHPSHGLWNPSSPTRNRT